MVRFFWFVVVGWGGGCCGVEICLEVGVRWVVVFRLVVFLGSGEELRFSLGGGSWVLFGGECGVLVFRF